MRNIIDLNS